jgi:hypothetical protein
MSFSTRSFVLVAILAGSALAACGSSSDTPIGNKPASETQTAAISVFPDKVTVGIDENGKALAAVPIGLTGATATVTWTSAVESVAKASGGEKFGSITAVKKGESKVTVKAGSKSATVDVTVATYASADVAKGKTEYETAKCTECHNASGPDITTSGLAKHSDDQILGAVAEGKNPEGGDIEGGHKYTATNAIVAYLRSLPARTDAPVKDE